MSFNRLEGDSLIQTWTHEDGFQLEYSNGFNRLEGDSLIQTDQPGEGRRPRVDIVNCLVGEYLIQTCRR